MATPNKPLVVGEVYRTKATVFCREVVPVDQVTLIESHTTIVPLSITTQPCKAKRARHKRTEMVFLSEEGKIKKIVLEAHILTDKFFTLVSV